MTQAVPEMTPYSTVVPFVSSLPTWMTPYDAQRVSAYQIYEQIYWNVPETFRLQMRGSDEDPIYIPTGRTIVDTTNRYLARDFAYTIEADVGTPADQQLLDSALRMLFRRERFWSKFAANKRYGLIRGDWLWHITANDAKPAGTRIKIEALDPASYFPVFESDVQDGGDPDKVVAVNIVEMVVVDEVTYIKRQTYTKGADPSTNDGSDTKIYNSIGYFDPKAWEDIRLKPVKAVKPPTPLPDQITSIPVYHIRNIEAPSDPFGSSELRGVERVLAGINQGISDEELALALEGLGMFATDGGPPKDASGQITDWILGPGSVAEHAPGSKFERITGIGTVKPMIDHLDWVMTHGVKEPTGTPDAAIGKVDVSVAESGISLILQLGPMLAKVSEKEQVITDVMRQMLFDLSQMWLPAYEGISTEASAVPIYGDTLPQNKEQQVTEIISMAQAGLVDGEWARQEIARIRGYNFDEGMAARILTEQQERARATDPFAERMSGELEIGQPGTTT